MTQKNETESRKKVLELIKDIKIATLVTHDEAGELHGRPMYAQTQENGELYFFTNRNSPKIAEIERDANVLLSYANPDDNNYVSISGQASMIDDRAKIEELWSETARAWFPKGVDDPNLVLLKVEAESAEYWDAPSSAFVIAYGYVKASITGKPPKAGEHGKAHYKAA